MVEKVMSHESEGYTYAIVGRELLLEVKNVHSHKYADCFVNKQNRFGFLPRPLMRKKNSLELVHTDECHVDAKSHAGAQYFVTFIGA